MNEYPKLNNESYVLYDRVMTPLAVQLERKPRRDHGMRRGRHSTSSSFAFDQLSSSHINNDDDDGNDEGTSGASTPPLIHYVNSLTNQVPQLSTDLISLYQELFDLGLANSSPMKQVLMLVKHGELMTICCVVLTPTLKDPPHLHQSLQF
ncbi:hypothetical protein Tco_0386763 [Tanacetum coccineum]